MTLHTVGPATMTEDEHKIGDGYQLWLVPVFVFLPILTAKYVEDTRWLIALGVAAGLVLLHEISGRLYDLCIRLRRTNLLLRDLQASQAETRERRYTG